MCMTCILNNPSDDFAVNRLFFKVRDFKVSSKLSMNFTGCRAYYESKMFEVMSCFSVYLFIGILCGQSIIIPNFFLRKI